MNQPCLCRPAPAFAWPRLPSPAIACLYLPLAWISHERSAEIGDPAAGALCSRHMHLPTRSHSILNFCPKERATGEQRAPEGKEQPPLTALASLGSHSSLARSANSLFCSFASFSPRTLSAMPYSRADTWRSFGIVVWEFYPTDQPCRLVLSPTHEREQHPLERADGRAGGTAYCGQQPRGCWSG